VLCQEIDQHIQRDGDPIVASEPPEMPKTSFSSLAGGKPATAFLFKLISQLQFSGTVPMIDVQAYAPRQ